MVCHLIPRFAHAVSVMCGRKTSTITTAWVRSIASIVLLTRVLRVDTRGPRFPPEKQTTVKRSTVYCGPLDLWGWGEYNAGMARFKTVAVFLVAWLAAYIVWSFLLRGLASKTDNKAVQGLTAVGVI